eukprot:5993610-Pleurochrysis_carterae.AAC.6
MGRQRRASCSQQFGEQNGERSVKYELRGTRITQTFGIPRPRFSLECGEIATPCRLTMHRLVRALFSEGRRAAVVKPNSPRRVQHSLDAGAPPDSRTVERCRCVMPPSLSASSANVRESSGTVRLGSSSEPFSR